MTGASLLDSNPHDIACVLADSQIWVEHGYLSDLADLQQHPNGRRFLESHAVATDELVNSQSLYHSPARVIEGICKTSS